MIALWPEPYQFPACAFCGASSPKCSELLIAGQHSCVVIECTACKRSYLADLPVGHALYTPGAVCLKTFELRSHPDAAWFSRSLVSGARAHVALRSGMPAQQVASPGFEVVRRRSIQQAIVVNCLDFLYGHVLLKLLNVQAHLDAGLDVVVIVPRSFRWLVPDAVAELWLVDMRLSEGGCWMPDLAVSIRHELERFERAWLSLAYGSHLPARIDIARFTRVERFAIERFSQMPRHITIVARQDRLWFGSVGQKFVYRVLRRLHAGTANRLFLALQERRQSRLVRELQRGLPGVKIAIVGIGVPSATPGVEDLRTGRIDDAVEKRWCEAYARSHVVIGIHGSNMLLPTAHAAGVIEILPEDRQGNVLQDILSPWEGRKASFLVRFVGEFAGVQEIVANAVGICRHYAIHCLQMEPDMLQHGEVTDTRSWQESYARAID